jgi:hypothetical protein
MRNVFVFKQMWKNEGEGGRGYEKSGEKGEGNKRQGEGNREQERLAALAVADAEAETGLVEVGHKAILRRQMVIMCKMRALFCGVCLEGIGRVSGRAMRARGQGCCFPHLYVRQRDGTSSPC